MNTLKSTVYLCAAGLVAIGLTGCPAVGPTRVVAAFTSDGNVAKSLVEQVLAGTDKADVPMADIASLTVTITEISLDASGSAEEEAKVVVFEGSTDVDLLDLQGVSEVISEAEVPPGTYTKIRLSIDNPRLVLAAEPDVTLTDIQLTANGRLFVSQSFEVPEGQTSLIILDFGGVKLVQQGNGGFTLTPQLDVSLTVTDADVTASGTVASVDAEASSLVLTVGDGEINVDLSQAVVFLSTDTDTATGSIASLSAGLPVTVEGLLNVDGSITAAVVRIVE